MSQADIIEKLSEILRERKQADPDSSYVASLYAAGLNKILEKVGEEATELVIAAKDAAIEERETNSGKNSELINETADLWFHTLVLLIHLEQDPNWVLEALEQRFGTSGHEEKASRGK